jgi:protein-S-isoprenylcysteine O-methyltransferase Ste14
MRPPPSASNFGLNLIGALGAVLALAALRAQHMGGPVAVLIVCAAGVVPIIVLDLLVLHVHRRESTGLDWGRPHSPDLARIATKLPGLGLTLGPIALTYFVFSEYHSDFYDSFYAVLRRFALSLVVGCVAYVWGVDGLMREPHDAYWQLGRVLLGHRVDARRADLANHARGWLVKAFYIPLFVVYVHGQLNGLLHFRLEGLSAADLRLYDFLNDLIYGLDVVFATVGYCLSFRILDAHLRSAEPTMLGWVVAVECYDPFWRGLFQRVYLHYEGVGFGPWLAGHTSLRWTWAAAILALEGVYVLATFAFGLRFSNLTHRGILTSGPYRFSKHPAYVAKNLSWWLVSVPFVPFHGWAEALRSCLALGCVNVVYLLRAKTEERHLSRDPVYVAYALWMNEHGLLRFLQCVPILRYSAPSTSERTLASST